jgi:hypothetical protein
VSFPRHTQLAQRRRPFVGFEREDGPMDGCLVQRAWRCETEQLANTAQERITFVVLGVLRP